MGFADWSPSHTILALFVVAGSIGQVAILFYRMGQAEKRQVRSEERAEKRDAELLAMIDKRITEVNQRIGEVNQRIDGSRSEMSQGFSDARSEINQQVESVRDDMNRGFADVRSEMNQQIESVRDDMNHRFAEMNQRLSDMDASIRQLNQNHIEHLTHHE